MANTFEYTWTDSNRQITVTPPQGHQSDTSFCGYNYAYMTSDRNLNATSFGYLASAPGSSGASSGAFAFASNSSYSTLSIYVSFSFTSNISSCTVKPFYYGQSGYILLSDEPIDVGIIAGAPSGTLSITENGTYDVSSYASAEVDVPPIYGDYHDDLVNINHSIVIASAVILVIYFFWCIYRMIIKPLRS